ncbi:hypothetical protein FOA52_005953 [Chlamydomonas sp. UWO 241]|nr:hypothetical protein FOA52_005953 [Chlamydomonas sp. UWO 241]
MDDANKCTVRVLVTAAKAAWIQHDHPGLAIVTEPLELMTSALSQQGQQQQGQQQQGQQQQGQQQQGQQQQGQQQQEEEPEFPEWLGDLVLSKVGTTYASPSLGHAPKPRSSKYSREP